MGQYYHSLSETKQQYKHILQRQKDLLSEELTRSSEDFSCERCALGDHFVLDAAMEPLHSGCGYQAWQAATLHWIEHEAAGRVLAKLNTIEQARNKFSCHSCGMCCRLASSEFSYETLQAQAAEGQEFARQFTSVFLPYASREAARSKAPEAVAAALAEASEEIDGEEKVFFYHCPYLGEDNRCTVYGTPKRPAICSSYPDTPLTFIAKNCAWKPWKDETHADTLIAHAMLALCEHFAGKLRAAVQNKP
jgi:Fe-S-cluster containining protein